MWNPGAEYRAVTLLLAAIVVAAGGAAAQPASPPAAAAGQGLTPRFDYDPQSPLGLERRVLRSDAVSVLEEVSFASPRGGRVPGFLVSPARPGRFAGILFGHWGGGRSTEFLGEAETYAAAGAVSLILDYPWVRPPQWRKSVNNFAQPEADFETYTQAVVDLRRGLDLLASLPAVDASRLGYVGHSYGAQWGAILAAVDRRPKALVLMTGVPSLGPIFLASPDPELVALRQALPAGQLERYVALLAPLDAERFIGRAAPAALLFQFARFERHFGEAEMQRFYAAASEPKEVRWYDTGHELADPRAFADRAGWLAGKLELTPAAGAGTRPPAAP